MLVNPDDSKYWRMQCRFGGAARLFAFDKYPDVSLAEARDLRHQAKVQIKAGVDPAQAKRLEKGQRANNTANT